MSYGAREVQWFSPKTAWSAAHQRRNSNPLNDKAFVASTYNLDCWGLQLPLIAAVRPTAVCDFVLRFYSAVITKSAPRSFTCSLRRVCLRGTRQHIIMSAWNSPKPEAKRRCPRRECIRNHIWNKRCSSIGLPDAPKEEAL